MASAVEIAFKELQRILKELDVNASTVRASLEGRSTLFDVDDAWQAQSNGTPRQVNRGTRAFGGDDLLAGTTAVCYLAAQLPVGEPLRQALPELADKMRARLENPELLLFAGFPRDGEGLPELEGQPYIVPGLEKYGPSGVDSGGLVTHHSYLHFRPARVVEGDHVHLRRLHWLVWPNATFPWSGYYDVWRAFCSPGFAAVVQRLVDTPLSAGQYEGDPRASAPKLVDQVRQRCDLSEDAATLYLQLLALSDCSEVGLREVNGWTAARLNKAATELASAKLVEQGKQPRATRKVALPGGWEKLRPPHPAMETWKLPLYEAQMEGKGLAAPLGRLVPLRPLHELFAAAWQRVEAGEGPGADRPTSAQQDDWIAAIAADPDGDEPRLVYADWLSERGDPRGELISVQCRRTALARRAGANSDAEAQAALTALGQREQELLARYEAGWTEAIRSHVEGWRFDRGFVTEVTVRLPDLVKRKGAEAVLDALPLLRALVLNHREGVGPIPDKHLDLLASSEALTRSRVEILDLTPDHYLRGLTGLGKLLALPWLERLRWLRLGFHRTGEGFGKRGAQRIAECEGLSGLRFLEIAGQQLAAGGAAALLASPHLTRLEVLRLPLNGIKTAGAHKLLEQLEQGALPALRVLDLSDVVGTDFVTKAAGWYRNRVRPELQQQLLRTLAARAGEGARYAGDVVPGEAQRRAAAEAAREVLPQQGRFPLAERAKSGRARCVVCGEPIKKESVRVGVERNHDVPGYSGRITAWLHPGCCAGCPELEGIEDLDARLKQTSPEVWGAYLAEQEQGGS